jgi:hypothetical protein
VLFLIPFYVFFYVFFFQLHTWILDSCIHSCKLGSMI